MASERVAAPPKPPAAVSSEANWNERIVMPTILAGLIGAGGGFLSKHRKVLGSTKVCAMYAANSAIVAGCYCGVREFVMNTRASDPDDLVNSAVGGFSTGAILGRLQGGQRGAFRYSVILGVAGPVFDLVNRQLYPLVNDISESTWKLPEWSPIQVLDEEALAAKHARERKVYSQKIIGDLNKEKSQ